MVLTSFSHGQISHFSGAIVQRPAAVFQLIDKINTQGRRESVQSTGQTNQQQTKKENVSSETNLQLPHRHIIIIRAIEYIQVINSEKTNTKLRMMLIKV
jgi:hypothetical protein